MTFCISLLFSCPTLPMPVADSFTSLISRSNSSVTLRSFSIIWWTSSLIPAIRSCSERIFFNMYWLQFSGKFNPLTIAFAISAQLRKPQAWQSKWRSVSVSFLNALKPASNCWSDTATLSTFSGVYSLIKSSIFNSRSKRSYCSSFPRFVCFKRSPCVYFSTSCMIVFICIKS